MVRIMSKQCNSDHASSPMSQTHIHIDTISIYTYSPSIVWEKKKRQNSFIWLLENHIVWLPPASVVSSITLVPPFLPYQENWTFSVSDAPYLLLDGDFSVQFPFFLFLSSSLNSYLLLRSQLKGCFSPGSFLDFSKLVISFYFQVALFIALIVVTTLYVFRWLLMYVYFPQAHTRHNHIQIFLLRTSSF